MTIKHLRCAIYTRKSSEEGLEQGFNSLDAQREACEAYVKSQVGEGWRAMPKAYDDGGFSGGSMDRPGLRALLADIEAGRVDIVVVYKVDRLTRSLADFAKIVETFDARQVSFVSVTQAFNTTSSMGRLTLNVLLSFAQFEREVTGERIRDKIAASKAKGMWMGGNLPLGYDAPTDHQSRALAVNELEAEAVRHIFTRYLQLRSAHTLCSELASQGIVSKPRKGSDGTMSGAQPFSRGALFHLLKNRVYIGEIVHKGQHHAGRHPGIVDRALFDAVQATIASKARQHKRRPLRSAAATLKGLIFDGGGAPMSPTFANGHTGKTYRYYVSAPLQQGFARKADDLAIRRLPAEAIEALVDRRLKVLGVEVPQRVEVHADSVRIFISLSAIDADYEAVDEVLLRLRRKLEPADQLGIATDSIRILVPIRMKLRGGRSWILSSNGEAAASRGRPSLSLVKGLRAGHRILREHGVHPHDEPSAMGRAPEDSYERLLARLAFLAPDIQLAILQGREPPGLTLLALKGRTPLAWADQRDLLDF